MDGEIEAAVENDGVAVGPVELGDRCAADNASRIAGHGDHVFEDGVVGEKVEEVITVGDPPQSVFDDAEERIEGFEVLEVGDRGHR